MLQKSTSRRVANASRATYCPTRTQWSGKHNRTHRYYRVSPPASKPFLPGDEVLKTLVGTIPGTWFSTVERFPDRDCFLVYGLNHNLFTTRADPWLRKLRNDFLADVGSLALMERDIPAHVHEAGNAFLSEWGYTSLTWNGRYIVASETEESRLKERNTLRKVLKRSFRNLEDLCKPISPFTYEAAPP